MSAELLDALHQLAAYAAALAQGVAGTKAADPSLPCAYETKLIRKLSCLADCAAVFRKIPRTYAVPRAKIRRGTA